MSSRSSKSTKNLIYALTGQAFGVIVSFIARIIFIKCLGIELLGINGLFTNILTVLSIAELGVGEAISYSLYKPVAEKNEKKCLSLMRLYRNIYSSIGIVVLLIGLSITPFLPDIINDYNKYDNINLIYCLFVINTSVSYFISYKRSIIIAHQNRYIVTKYKYLYFALLNIVQSIYLLIFKDFIGFQIIQIACTILENASVSMEANRLYPYLKQKKYEKISPKEKKEIAKNAKAMMMHKIGGIAISSTDNIVLTKFVSLEAVGLYSNYNMITNALNIILVQIFSASMASIGNLCVTGTVNHQYKTYNKLNFLGFVAYSLSVCCVFNIINDFITLWLGSDYLLSQEIVVILSINLFIYGMRRPVLCFREAAGLFYKDRWKSVIEAIANIVLSVILASSLGIFGVFLGTFLSSVLISVWVEPYVLFKYQFNLRLREYFKKYTEYAFVTLFIVILSMAICSFLNITNVLLLIITKALICISISVAVITLLYKNTEEFKYYKLLARKTLQKRKN